MRKREERAQRVVELRTKYERLSPELDERARRMWAALEARSIRWGGLTQVAEATGLAKTTIMRGPTLINPRTMGPAACASLGADVSRQASEIQNFPRRSMR